MHWHMQIIVYENTYMLTIVSGFFFDCNFWAMWAHHTFSTVFALMRESSCLGIQCACMCLDVYTFYTYKRNVAELKRAALVCNREQKEGKEKKNEVRKRRSKNERYWQLDSKNWTKVFDLVRESFWTTLRIHIYIVQHTRKT